MLGVVDLAEPSSCKDSLRIIALTMRLVLKYTVLITETCFHDVLHLRLSRTSTASH